MSILNYFKIDSVTMKNIATLMEFEAFSASKDNNKETLWKKLEIAYLDGIKRTLFMAHLTFLIKITDNEEKNKLVADLKNWEFI
nr:14417_t:CDS:2 [Entrophospora candida]